MRREMGSDTALVPDDPCGDNGLTAWQVPSAEVFLSATEFHDSSAQSRVDPGVAGPFLAAYRRKNQKARISRAPQEDKNDRRAPAACLDSFCCDRVDIGERFHRRGAGMQEPRTARHALLRREQRSRRRCSNRPEEA